MSTPSTTTSATTVELTRQGNVATIRFSSEKGVNVLSSRVLGDIGSAVEEVAEDARLRFVVFRGAGKTFLAGADIAEMSTFNEERGKSLSTHGHHVFNAIANLPQVTFAAINGAALGGGCELALACDFRIMAATARAGQPECQLGLIPGWGGTSRLPKIVGPAWGRRLLFTGEGITAEQALQIGLVNETVATPELLDDALQRWFVLLAKASPKAITRIKRAMAQNDEINQFACCFSCSDAEEGMQAFMEKRPPAWTRT